MLKPNAHRRLQLDVAEGEVEGLALLLLHHSGVGGQPHPLQQGLRHVPVRSIPDQPHFPLAVHKLPCTLQCAGDADQASAILLNRCRSV